KAAKARASFFMQFLQRQGIQMCGIAHNNSRVARMPSAKCGRFVPLCLRPERLAWLYIKPYLHLRRRVSPDFPELSYPPAVPCTWEISGDFPFGGLNGSLPQTDSAK